MATPTSNDFRNPLAVAKAVLSAATSVTATLMVMRPVVRPFTSHEVEYFLFSRFRGFLSRFCNKMTMVIKPYEADAQNELFGAAQVFLAAKQSVSIRRVRVTKSTKENHSTLAIVDRNQMLVDTFHGVKLWVFVSRQVGSGNRVHQGHDSAAPREDQYFELTFDKKHMEIVDKSYLPFVMDEARSIKQGKKTLKLYTPCSDDPFLSPWSPVNLDHPATFQTLAMDLELKNKIIDDRDRPPRMGKSSLVAAMANYLNFDIYDLELSELWRNADLRRLLVATANQSILVVEDNDYTIHLQDRNSETRAASINSMLIGYQRKY
ncbi:LOW QUALITY PROTEIN: hypothetical protein EUGRSUZ_J02367 [Eucalyptus grandis]|uniref:Uncharacterized protein n=1 Tax=Eucalyptus grandis TaxID=71139 RepID=A0ACC3J9M5_EUCGR|nr:LOW QUALITY PROTEIN: hypothetical protein EUGRSUZ_J02367 [Eucalyptus grandis]